VIEKEDHADYVMNNPVVTHDRFLILPKSNQGIAYARNFCKDHATEEGHCYHWQIDDNIKRFKKRVAGTNMIKSPFVILEEAEDYVLKHKNIGIAGLKHACFAFAAREELGINQQIYTCMLINNMIDKRWRSGCVEDTDYSMQILTAGYCTVLFNRLIMDKATTMSQSGGNTEISYAGDGRLKRAEGLQKLWPDIFKLGTRKDGSTKVNPSRIWKGFKQRPILKDEH
jgi:hypothetical protein